MQIICNKILVLIFFKVMDQKKKDKMITRLKESGIKITRQRKSIIESIAMQKRPFTASKLFLSLGKNIDIVTIYRNLKLLNRLGLLFSESYNGQQSFYYSDNHHHHIRCIKCGRVDCVQCFLDTGEIEGYSEIRHDLVLKGICDDCKKTYEGN